MIYKCLLALFSAVILFSVVPAAEDNPERLSGRAVWSDDFNRPQKNGVPHRWKVEGTKIGVPKTVCRIKNAKTDDVLEIICNKSTGGIIIPLRNIDLKKTPILRWRWRVLSYPQDGDGRNPAKDDQPVAVYIGTNDGLFKKRSIAYRWETLTPKGFEGQANYAGILKVHYVVMQNNQTGTGKWVTETRNIAEDFKRVYGNVPREFALSIIGNSQYTGSNTVAEIDFIEFLPSGK